MKRAALIVNPVSGRARARSYLFDIVKALCARDYEVVTHLTQKRLDAAVASEKYSNAGFDLVVCVGGDGTLNEVISGITASRMSPELLYIPLGSTNDFAATLGLPKMISTTPEKFIASRKDILELDVGKINGERDFLYVASFGIFTKTSYTTKQDLKNVLGHLAYVLEGSKEIVDLNKTYHVKVTHDGGVIEGDYVFGAVTNCTSMGGIVKLPKNKVKLDDGKFELLLVKTPQNPVQTHSFLNMLFKGRGDGRDYVFVQTSHALFECENEVAWCVDGEFAGNLRDVDIVCNPHAVKLRK